MNNNQPAPAKILKEHFYNRDSRDFDLYLNKRYIGSAATMVEANRRLDEAAYAEASHPLPTGTEEAPDGV